MSTILTLISLTVFSQTGTTNRENDVKCFPVSVTKQIAQDLLRGDSALAELKLTNVQLEETEKKVEMKDNIISTYVQKEKNYIKIIDLEREKFNTLKDFNDNLQLELKKQKLKSKITSIGSISVIGVMGFLIISK